MALNKVRIGDYIELVKKKCGISNLTVDDVSGINKEKEFFEPSKQVGKDTSDYKIVPPGCFACNLMHVGRDIALPIALNRSNKNKIVSPAYTVFRLKNENVLLKEYFFMYLNSSEKDRFFWFHCDSSVRDGMDWKTFCNLKIDIPEKRVQEKYVSIYDNLRMKFDESRNMIPMLNSIQNRCIEMLLSDSNVEQMELNKFAHLSDERNENLNLKNVYGLTVYKKFIETKADMSGVALNNYKIVRKGNIAYVPTTNRNGDKIACGLCYEDCIVSSTYEVMSIDTSIVEPEYLFLFFKRREMDRYARYYSWGSARETISWRDLSKIAIPIPDKNIQKNIVNIFNSYIEYMDKFEKLKYIISKICPTLIKGSLIEAEGGQTHA